MRGRKERDNRKEMEKKRGGFGDYFDWGEMREESLGEGESCWSERNERKMS